MEQKNRFSVKGIGHFKNEFYDREGFPGRFFMCNVFRFQKIIYNDNRFP